MRLTPRETDKLMIVVAGDVARRRLERGLKLNHPEATALITAELMERARDGQSVSELMEYGTTILTENDVMDGVAALLPSLQVEATFPDGTKLIPIDTPIRSVAQGDEGDVVPQGSPIEKEAEASGTTADSVILGGDPVRMDPSPGEIVSGDESATKAASASSGTPGEFILSDEPITINEGRETLTIEVKNPGDRPVQVGSHYHFYEANPALQFDRNKTIGFRLDIPAGTAARFEPGDAREVNLVAYGGAREVYGFRNEWNGPLDTERSPTADSDGVDGNQEK